MQHFLRFNSLLFGIPSGDFQHTNCSVDFVLPQLLVSDKFVFISKQILRACILSEQVVVLKIIPTYLL